MKKVSKADMIRDIADHHGGWRSNKHIQKLVAEKYNVDVLSSQVSNVLGRTDTRQRPVDNELINAGRRLAVLCDFDKGLMYRVLSRYC